jgi:hypothetical protein
MIFSLCLPEFVNVALDPVASSMPHARLWAIDHIYVLACLPSY